MVRREVVQDQDYLPSWIELPYVCEESANIRLGRSIMELDHTPTIERIETECVRPVFCRIPYRNGFLEVPQSHCIRCCLRRGFVEESHNRSKQRDPA